MHRGLTADDLTIYRGISDVAYAPIVFALTFGRIQTWGTFFLLYAHIHSGNAG